MRIAKHRRPPHPPLIVWRFDQARNLGADVDERIGTRADHRIHCRERNEGERYGMLWIELVARIRPGGTASLAQQ